MTGQTWLFLFLFGVAALCSLPGMAGEPIRVGVSLDQSGPYAPMGRMQALGYRLWESRVNETGGLMGRPVHLSIEDDEGDPARAAGLYREMIEKRQVDLVFGPYSGRVTEAVLPVTEARRYPVLVAGAAADGLWDKGYRHAFGVMAPASRYSVGFLELMVKKRLRRLALVHSTDASSLAGALGMIEWSRRFRLEVAIREPWPASQETQTEVIGRIRAVSPDALLVFSSLTESIGVGRRLRESGWRPGAWFSTVGPANREFHDALGPTASGVFSPSLWEESMAGRFPGGEAFVAQFHSKYGQAPNYYAASAYSAGMILETALARAGGVDRSRIRDVLAELDTLTLMGRYGVDQTGRSIHQMPLIVQWLEGTGRVVWPQSLSASNPVWSAS